DRHRRAGAPDGRQALPGARRPRLHVFVLVGGLLLGWISGCAVPEPRPVQVGEMETLDPQKLLQRERQLSLPGPPPLSEKLEPITRRLEPEIRLYHLVFDRAPLGEIITAITKDTDLNLTIEADIDLVRPVTVKLKNVTFQEALDMVVVKGAGYAWRIERGTLEIRRFEERIYHLDYLDMTGETVIDVGGDMLASSVEESGVAGKYQIKTNRTRENTDVWTAVRETLEGLKSPDGILRLNRSAGMIYLADTPTRIASMVRFLDSLGETLRRQVFIEARILEVRLSDSYRYGIDWTRINVGFVTDATALADNFFVNFNRGGGIFRADSSVFEAVIDFLRTQGDVSVLSKPHLSVMNGQSSLMTVGFQFPYGDVDGVDRDAQTGLVTIGTSIRRAVLGLQLGITPQIAADGIVTLHIVPTITRIQGTEQVEIPTTSTTVLKIANPVIDLQELATTVSVREGHTIVLAGLISQMKKLDTEGLPFFSKIPFLKYFFGRVENEIENRELVVLITPYIKKAL
ncbi:MAG: hypothetical protein MUP74_04005, partial [Desulfobacterales bacterium]|nr:hypothetical protein [Desulfobacterales bacterium]